MLFLLYKTYWWQRFWWFSEDFRSLSENFRSFSKIVPKVRRTFPNIFRKFPKMSEDVRRLPKTFGEDPKKFRWYTNKFKYNLRDKLDITEVIDIFTCEDIISSHVRISYRFYQFVTTRYTTDFYIIKRVLIYSPWMGCRVHCRQAHCRVTPAPALNLPEPIWREAVWE